jgi:hypothetical protein
MIAAILLVVLSYALFHFGLVQVGPDKTVPQTPLGDPSGTLGASGILLSAIIGTSGLVPSETHFIVKPAYLLLSVLFGLMLILAKFFPRSNLPLTTILKVAVLTGVIGQLSTGLLLGLEIQYSAAEAATVQSAAIALIVVILAVMVAIVWSECYLLVQDITAANPNKAVSAAPNSAAPQLLHSQGDGS